MNSHDKPSVSACPESSEISDLVWADAQKAFADLVEFCRKSELPFGTLREVRGRTFAAYGGVGLLSGASLSQRAL